MTSCMSKTSLARVVLIGYRGSGKSTVGRMLAERLGLAFVDTDTRIEERSGLSIKEMVEKKGWPYFRTAEKEVIRSLAREEGMVMAVGGGAILDAENRESLKQNSLVFYLAADPATLALRISQDTKTEAQRPSLTGREVMAEIGMVLEEREPLYRKVAHYVVDTEDRTVDEVVQEIIGIMEAPRCKPRG